MARGKEEPREEEGRKVNFWKQKIFGTKQNFRSFAICEQPKKKKRKKRKEILGGEKEATQVCSRLQRRDK